MRKEPLQQDRTRPTDRSRPPRGWSLLGALLAAACASAAPAPDAPAGASSDPSSTTLAQSKPDGTALYTQHCASCHHNEKKGRPAAATKKAIDEDVGKMGSLRFLTAAQLAAIAAAP